MSKLFNYLHFSHFKSLVYQVETEPLHFRQLQSTESIFQGGHGKSGTLHTQTIHATENDSDVL